MGKGAVAAACMVLLPTILLGAAFPAALRLTAVTPHAGRDTGSLLAWNTIGGIAGSLSGVTGQSPKACRSAVNICCLSKSPLTAKISPVGVTYAR